jgi:hypothetical protein
MPDIALAAAAIPSLSRDELPPLDGPELATIPACVLSATEQLAESARRGSRGASWGRETFQLIK